MKKLLLLSLVALMINSFAGNWYDVKGTLNQATAVDWHKAEYANKLSTAGDIVAVGFQEKLFVDKIQFTNMEQVKIFAEGLVKCIDTGTTDKAGNILESAKDQQVYSLAIVCMNLMGWLKTE